MENRLVYEHPLNERIRTLLRIENLFNRLTHYSKSTDAQDMRLSITLLIDLNELLKLSDTRIDLARELERCQSALRALEGNPGVDAYKLKQILSDLNASVETIRNNDYQPGAELDRDELITSIKKKGSLAGGACNFDLPAYNFWLNKSTTARQKSLKGWQEDLSVIRKSAELVLALTRSNAITKKETAEKGYYQQSIDSGAPYQLIRIITPRELKCFPEISGGKHRITVRFMEQAETQNRPVQTEKDVEFELHFCVS